METRHDLYEDIENNDIISDKALDKIGVLYESRKKYERKLRTISNRISGTPLGRRNVSVRIGDEKQSPSIGPGITISQLGNLSAVKNISIIGSSISTAKDAAIVFSPFRDPRIELFNIVLTDSDKKILSHTAWTSTLPSCTIATYGSDFFDRLKDKMKKLNAEYITLFHNHPSSVTDPSLQDIKITQNFIRRFPGQFYNHIILDYNEYTVINRNEQITTYKFDKPLQNYNSYNRNFIKQIKEPKDIVILFKDIFLQKKINMVFAVLDNSNRIVSWVPGDNCNINDVKHYMRLSGGSKIIAISNNELLFNKTVDIAKNTYGTDLDIFLNVIKVNPETAQYEHDYFGYGGQWQLFEKPAFHFLVKNEITPMPVITYISDNKENIMQHTQSNKWSDVKPDKSWWVLAFQKDDKIIFVVDDGDKIDHHYIKNLKNTHGSEYEIYGPYSSKNSASSAVVEIEKDIKQKIAKVSESHNNSVHGMENNYKVKEKTMSDEINAEMVENTKDLKEQAFLNAVHQRKVIADALKVGTLSCLPGDNGAADTKPAVNLVNGTFYHGSTLLYLKEVQKKEGYPTAEWASIEQIQKAQEENPAIAIRKGQHGVTLNVSEKIKGTDDQYESKTIKLFNVAQTVHPGELKTWAEQKQQEKLQEKLEYLRSQYGSNYQLPSVTEKTPGPEIVCSSTVPDEYIGQYLAAVSMGGQFKASPEQAKEFGQKMEAELYKGIGKISEKTGQEVSDPFSFSKIGIAASTYCKEYMKSLNLELRKQNHEQKQEKQRGRNL